jgi:adenylyl-sulfate kinase
MEKKVSNVTWHNRQVKKEEREKRNKHQGVVIWFTGLSGAGKSTIAVEVDKFLFDMGAHTYILDGDNVRHRLNKDLGFSQEDRTENIRRIGEVAWLFADSGAIVLTAFISPYRKDRALARSLLDKGDFVEVYVKADLETCIKRDPKGLYKKALAGEISDFTGVSAPYEKPEDPELVLDTVTYNVKECSDQLVEYLVRAKIVDPPKLKLA